MDATTLKDFEGQLRGRLQGGTLVLEPRVVDSQRLDMLLGTLPGQRLELEQAELALAEQATPPTLTVTGSVSQAWPIRGTTGTGLNGIRVRLVLGGGEGTGATLSVEGHLAVGNALLPVAGALETDGLWRLGLGSGEVPTTSLTGLVDFGGGPRMVRNLPVGAALFEDVSVRSIELSFGQGTTATTRLRFSVAPSGDWEIVPGQLALSDVGVNVRIRHEPWEEGQLRSSFGGDLQATTEVGRRFYTFLSFRDRDRWELRIDGDEDGLLPDLATLASLVGGEDLADSIETGLSALGLGSLSLDGASIGFDLGRKAVTSVGVKGSLTVAGVGVDVKARLPDVQLLGRLSEGSSIDLKALVEHFFGAAEGIPALDVTALELVATPLTGGYSLYATVTSDWSFDVGGTSLALERVELSVERSRQGVGGSMIAALRLSDDVRCLMTADYDPMTGWTFSGSLSRLNLSALVAALMPGESLASDLPDFELSDLQLSYSPKTGAFSVSGQTASPWDIPVGVVGLSLRDVKVHVSRAGTSLSTGMSGSTPATGSTGTATGSQQVMCRVSGTLRIAGNDFTAQYALPGELVLGGHFPSVRLGALLDELCDSELLGEVSIPSWFTDLTLENVRVSLSPTSRTLMLASAVPGFDTCAFLVSKGADGKWGFGVALVPEPTWKLSSLSDVLAPLDGLSFSNTALVLSSAENGAFLLPGVPALGAGRNVGRGLNLTANVSFVGTGVDQLIGLQRLDVRASIGPSLDDFALEAGVAGEFTLADGVVLRQVRLRLKPAPSSFDLLLLGNVSVTTNDETLVFLGGVAVTPNGASFQATMTGIWNEPFGARGVVLSNLAVELGISFQGVPSIGLTGQMAIGTAEGGAGFKFDSAVPSRSMIAVWFNRLDLAEILGAMCDASIGKAIPPGLSKTLLAVRYEDVDFRIVPQPTQIGAVRYQQGIRFAGRMHMWGLAGDADVSIDYVKGIQVDAGIDAIRLGQVFALTGPEGRERPELHFVLSPTQLPSLELSGSVTMLGLTRAVLLSISDEGFRFMMSGKLFDVFEASLDVSGGDLASTDNIRVKAVMRNELLAYLTKHGGEAIEKATEVAVSQLAAARGEVARLESSLKSLDGDIDAMRRTVEKERERDAAKVRDAQAQVDAAKRDLEAVDKQVMAQRQVIDKERRNAQREVENAQRSVLNAQGSLDALDAQIDNANDKIKKLKKDIKKKKDWFDDSSDLEKSWRWAEYSAYVAEKNAEIIAQQAYIETLKASKKAASGALEAAKKTLEASKGAIVTFPIDADPRMVPLLAARETAAAALEVAKKGLQAVEATIQKFPVEADPRVAGLLAAKESAKVALKAAKETLRGVEKALGPMGSVASEILALGLKTGELLDVRAASFQASLSVASGGRVSMSAEVVFLKKPKSVTFDFDFHDPLESAERLARRLLPV